MSDYTPGPWEAITNDDPRGQPSPMYRSLICTVEHAPERYLAVVQKGGLTSSREQWQGNARLIAASPDLLTALKHIMEDFCVSDLWIEMAKKAIAKAERK